MADKEAVTRLMVSLNDAIILMNEFGNIPNVVLHIAGGKGHVSFILIEDGSPNPYEFDIPLTELEKKNCRRTNGVAGLILTIDTRELATKDAVFEAFEAADIPVRIKLMQYGDFKMELPNPHGYH